MLKVKVTKRPLRAADDAPRPKRGGWTIKTGRRRRPVAYSEALADLICDAISQGGALYRLCEERAEFPSEPTVYRWLDTRPGFARNTSVPVNCSRTARPTGSWPSPTRPTMRRLPACASTAANGGLQRWLRGNMVTGSTSIIPVRCSNSATNSSMPGLPSFCARRRARAATRRSSRQPSRRRPA